MATTPNMNLTIPEVLVTTGPNYATQVNQAFDEIDSHDHSTGKGARITPSGLNINTTLPLNNNSLTNVKAVTLATQTSITNNKSIYSKGNDLFFRDANGTEIQLTASGAVNVSGVGGFTGLVSPASATYTALSDTFGFFSDSGEYAIVATGDLKIFPRTGSQAVTLVADLATAAYNLQLPTVAPAESSFMRMKVGNPAVFVDLLGTNNQITVTHNAGDTTLSLPQDIATTSSPTFDALTLTGTLTGVGALLSADVEIQGDLNLTKASSGVLDAPLYLANFGTVASNFITPLVGTSVSISTDVDVAQDLTVNRNVSVVETTTTKDLTITNNVTMSGIVKTFSAPAVTATFGTLNVGNVSGTSAVFSSSISAFTASITGSLGTPDIQTDTITSSTGIAGVYIQGRFNGSSPGGGAVGEIQLYAPASNITCSTSYQNLYAVSLTAGIWEVSGCVAIIGNNAVTQPSVRFLQGGVSLTSAATDDVRYARSQAAPITLVLGEQIDIVTFSRRLNLSSATDVYLVGRVIGSNVNQALFEAARTTLKIQRVG